MAERRDMRILRVFVAVIGPLALVLALVIASIVNLGQTSQIDQLQQQVEALTEQLDGLQTELDNVRRILQPVAADIDGQQVKRMLEGALSTHLAWIQHPEWYKETDPVRLKARMDWDRMWVRYYQAVMDFLDAQK
jgi:predicted PurR-regulated permease PerM